MALCGVILTAGCVTVAPAPSSQGRDGGSGSDEQPVMGNQVFVISAAEIPGLQDLALRGSAEAAFKLARFHNMVTLDFKEGLYWMTIAAENGYPGATYELGFYLRLQDDPRSKLRARYWLGRAQNEGREPAATLAKSLLKEMDQQEK
jgi:TPR repeat protein